MKKHPILKIPKWFESVAYIVNEGLSIDLLSKEIDKKILPLFYRIESLELSIRSSNCLNKIKIEYLIELIQLTEANLMRISNLGRKSLTEIKNVLSENDLQLGTHIHKLPDSSIEEGVRFLENHIDQLTLSGSKSSKSIDLSLRRTKLLDETTLKLGHKIEDLDLSVRLIELPDETILKLVHKIEDLDLSVRSLKCLKKLKIEYIGDLVSTNVSSLLKTKNFGRRSLSEIKDKLKKINLSLDMKISGWNTFIKNNQQESFLKKINKDETKVLEIWPNLKQKANVLEEELFNFANILRKHPNKKIAERNLQIFIKYFGWDGDRERTLETIGMEYGLTRERVRQICDKFEENIVRKIKTQTPNLPNLDISSKFIIKHMPACVEDIEYGLKKKGISQKCFRLEGILKVFDLLGREKPFFITKIAGNRFVVKYQNRKLPKLITHLSKKIVSRRGVATISDIVEQLKIESNKTNYNFVISVLSKTDNFNWLDESSGWFWLSSQPRNRLLNVIKKVISVSSKIEIGELRGGISRFHRMEGFAPPKRVLLELCKQLPWCQIEGTIVSTDPPLNWEDVLKGTTEWAMAAILKEYGLVMSRKEFERRCIELGMNENTFYQYLTFSPIITKYSLGVYGLRGAIINPGIIESIKPKRKPQKVLNDYGWTSDGKIWIGLQISRGTIQSGVCSVPSAMYKFLNGEFKLRAADGIHIGSLKIKNGAAWSLKKFFQRRGGDPGDFLVIKFDPSSREARTYLGDKDLLDDFRPEY